MQTQTRMHCREVINFIPNRLDASWALNLPEAGKEWGFYHTFWQQNSLSLGFISAC